MANSATSIQNLLGENLNLSGSWGNVGNNSPRTKSKRQNIFKKAQAAFRNQQATRKAAPIPPTSSGMNSAEMGRVNPSSFLRNYGRNPNSYKRSRRRRHGRPSRSSNNEDNAPAPMRYFPAPEQPRHQAAPRHQPAPRHQAAAAAAAPGPKPRAGKFMRECRANSEAGGCARHKATQDCKFVHRDEPEWAMLREDQKKRGGAVPPMSSVNTYTSWSGGIDPSSKLYSQAPKI